MQFIMYTYAINYLTENLKVVYLDLTVKSITLDIFQSRFNFVVFLNRYSVKPSSKVMKAACAN